MKQSKIKWLFENMKGYRCLYVLGIIGAITYNVMQLIVPVVTQKIIDLFMTGENASANLVNKRDVFFLLIAAMIILTLIRTMIVYATSMLFEYTSQGALYKIRNYLFDKVQRQDQKFYQTYRTGDLMTRLTGDLDAVRHMIAWVIRTIIESFTLVLATFFYFVYMDVKLALCIIVIAPGIFVVIVLFKNKVGPMHRLLREKLSLLNTISQENISGNRVVKAFAREDYEIEKFDECSREFSDTNMKTSFVWLKYFPFMETFADLLPVVLMVVGGFFLIDGSLTMGEYAAFSGLIWAVANPMRNLGSIMNEFQRFSAASTKIMEIYYSEPEIVTAPDAIDRPERFEGNVEFKNVSFSYDDGIMPVLNNISFSIKAGETVAIMGETGCGKTSLVHLIPRFFEPVEGEVLIDGIDTRKLKLKQLRSNIGLATQEVLLYSDTIDGNIAYGNYKMSEADVKKYAKYSAAAEFISKMPEGYETVVGERGVGLSGGQKQRISLARALAIKPAILILDDTTSAVDMETEKEIQQSLNNLDFSCTKIIIAQRISTTKNADKIIVLSHGSIIEMGTHKELLAKRGYYYEVAKLQLGEEVL
ncbi:MAG: ABC transporter ATP-binding protein [Clostridiales bacterium]|nr:ABC transporter ATP-binding protein [Clostridiales bacterium]